MQHPARKYIDQPSILGGVFVMSKACHVIINRDGAVVIQGKVGFFDGKLH
jgi:hypothetical protein